MKKYKIKYKRNKRVIMTIIVLTHDRLLKFIERPRNKCSISIVADYELDGERKHDK